MADYEDFTIDQGADVAIELRLEETDGTVKDLSFHTARAKMKRSYNATDPSDIVDFTAIVAEPPEDGTVVLSLSNTQTDNLNPRSTYVYDVELQYYDSDDNPIVERILEGKIKVSPSVTR